MTTAAGATRETTRTSGRLGQQVATATLDRRYDPPSVQNLSHQPGHYRAHVQYCAVESYNCVPVKVLKSHAG
jgi:hypothetical protein